MTQSGNKHDASVFLQLPDGNGQFYQLIGIAEHPKPIQIPLKDVAAKSKYIERISVTNWLKQQQRFRVEVEITKPDRVDSGLILKGRDYFDLRSDEIRDYELELYAHREGLIQAKICFRNQQTEEFIVYHVQFKVIQSVTTEVINLTTKVRQTIPYTICIPNPLNHPVTLTSETKVHELIVPPSFQIPANGTGSCTFEFQPLRQGPSTGKLTFHSPDLGSYYYNLNLTAKRPDHESPIHFTTPLGTMQTKTVRFQNFAKQKVEFTTKLSSPHFTTEKSIQCIQAGSSNGSEVTFEVHFEPISCGKVKTDLCLSSNIGGEYTFPLVATCSPPKPQGPFTIRPKSQVSIPFKNVFNEPTEFNLHTDNPVFSLQKHTELIKSKKENVHLIYFIHLPIQILV